MLFRSYNESNDAHSSCTFRQCHPWILFYLVPSLYTSRCLEYFRSPLVLFSSVRPRRRLGQGFQPSNAGSQTGKNRTQCRRARQRQNSPASLHHLNPATPSTPHTQKQKQQACCVRTPSHAVHHLPHRGHNTMLGLKKEKEKEPTRTSTCPNLTPGSLLGCTACKKKGQIGRAHV